MSKVPTKQYSAFHLKHAQLNAGIPKLEWWKRNNEFNRTLGQALFYLKDAQRLLRYVLKRRFDLRFQRLPFAPYFYASNVETEKQRFVFLTNNNDEFKKLETVTQKEGLLAVYNWVLEIISEFQDIRIEPDNPLRFEAHSIETNLILCSENLIDVIRHKNKKNKTSYKAIVSSTELDESTKKKMDDNLSFQQRLDAISIENAVILNNVSSNTETFKEVVEKLAEAYGENVNVVFNTNILKRENQ